MSETSLKPEEDDPAVLGAGGGFAPMPSRSEAEAISAQLEAKKEWTCKVRHAGTTDPPQDCDWPWCGCDPQADRILAALQEEGLRVIDGGVGTSRIALLKTSILQLARDIGTVLSVAERRTDPDEDHRQMLSRLSEWRARLFRLADLSNTGVEVIECANCGGTLRHESTAREVEYWRCPNCGNPFWWKTAHESRSPDGDGHEKGTVVGMETSAPERPRAGTNEGTRLEGQPGKPVAAEPPLRATSSVSPVVQALGHAAGSEPADSHQVAPADHRTGVDQ